MINRETIWAETYTRDFLSIDKSRVEVFTAIHHYTGGGASKLNLCSEIAVELDNGATTSETKVKLTADQMEQLADYLYFHAKRSRQLVARLDNDEAEHQAAAAEAIKEARVAA